ncbi:serine protease inhibitor 42Dd-like [Drosophila novamexicana]|uniref:serine protease inhibitor 42Dd-like n=1 Tax=Drosophila novamexicana TaxID=47314 RepID=UPI0011E5E884|nr:serine protease inhibitor 42Dd-like [Drosophila novamexicana]
MDENDGTKTFFSVLSAFSSNLFNRLFTFNPGKNLICAPLAIHTCLGMLRLGAEDETTTAQELDNRVGFTSIHGTEIAEDFHNTLSSYQESSVLHMAYKIYLMHNYEIRQEFHNMLTENFHSEPELINFSENIDAANTINEWVDTKMNHLIKDEVSPEILDDSTRMVLISAAHFKAEWSKRFEPKATRREFFHMDDWNKVKVHMMNVFHEYYYAELKDLDAKVLRLTFRNTELQMLIILPNRKMGLENLLKILSRKSLQNIIAMLALRRVNIKLPKFSTEFEQELTPLFIELGVKRVFIDKAELGKMLETNQVLKVSKILHKAYIEFNEEGNEVEPLGEPVVPIVRGKPRNPLPPVNFFADHPFYYAIYDESHGPLIAGGFQVPTPAGCIDNPKKPCSCER